MIGVNISSFFKKIFIFICLKANCLEFFYLENEQMNSKKIFMLLKFLLCFSIYLILMMFLFLVLCCIMSEELSPYLSVISRYVNVITPMQLENDLESDECKGIIDNNTNIVDGSEDTSFHDSGYYYTEHIFSSYTSSGSYEPYSTFKECKDLSMFENREDIYNLLYSLKKMPKKSDIMSIWYQAIYVAKNSSKMADYLKKYMWYYFAYYPKQILPKHKEFINIIGRKFSEEVSFKMYPYLIKYNERFIKLVEEKPCLNVIVKYIYGFTEFLYCIKRHIFLRHKKECFKYIIDHKESLEYKNNVLKYIDILKN